MAETRIGTLASNNALINIILRTQARIEERQVQVTSEKQSQVYTGIGQETQRLVSLETTTSALTRFIQNNEAMNLRLDIVADALEGAAKVIDDFRDALDRYATSATKDEAQVADIQDWAFRSLQSLQALLNTQADGRYIFAGGRVLTTPVDLGLTTLANFQATYDGARVTYPTTRDAHLEKFTLSDDGAATPDTTWLRFQRDAGSGVSRVTATTARFSNIAVGTKITITGTTSNNGTYTVSAVGGGGTTIDIVTEQLTDEAAVATTVSYDDPLDPYARITVPATLTFTRATNTIAHGGTLNNIPVGAAFTIAGSASNNGTYTVLSNSGGNIVIEAKRFTDEGGVGTEVAGTIAASNYYSGDAVTLTHRVDTDRDFSFDITAIDPAFEKAIRAMSLIAQGVYGTEGGLDQHPERITQARYLLNSALERTVAGDPPFGTELTSNIELLSQTTGFRQVLVKETNEAHDRFIGFLDTSVERIENVDMTETITRLLDDVRALQASYQSLARIRELSLTNFL